MQRHERYPVIVLDHADPKACDLGNPASPLLQLGRSRDTTAPSCRPVVVVDDSGLEVLRQGGCASCVVPMDGGSEGGVEPSGRRGSLLCSCG